MGGKNKQRTKNNVRPSSSGRSAELLNNAGALDASLLATGGKYVPNMFPTLAAVTLDPNLGPEFAICIKKLNKKDPITKYKALQELTELINKSNAEEVESVLPSWSHLYKILSVDADCRVREAAQAGHGALARMAGRRLAPALRQLLPAWLQAQYDDHAPASSLAQLSLKNTFPDSKLPEVISFCKTEVMEYLEERLTESGTEERALVGALHGLAWVVQHAPHELHEWLHGRLHGLLQRDAFWAHAAHESAAVRAAWFLALGALLQRGAALASGERGPRLLRALLRPERDARAAGAAWAALLLLMHHAQDWQTWLGKSDLLSKKIINVLENGGWGSARALAETLLPLLAALPPALATQGYYSDFFAALHTGLEKKAILNSKSERQSWITGMAECLRYLSGQPHEYVAELVTGVHRRWLETALALKHDAQLANSLTKHSATCMTSLVKYWLKQSNEQSTEKYDQLVRNFWQNVCSTILAQLEQAPAEQRPRAAEGHVLLLLTLQKAFGQEGAQQRRVAFEGDAPRPQEPEAARGAEVAAARGAEAAEAAGVAQRYEHNLAEVVHRVAANYIEVAEQQAAPEAILQPLLPLLSSFDSAATWAALAQQLGAAGACGLGARLLRAGGGAAVDAAFLLLPHMSEEEQDAIFAMLDEPPLSSLALSRALSHPHCTRAATLRWLRGAGCASALRSAERRELLAALAPREGAEPLVGAAAVRALLRDAAHALRDAPSSRAVAAAEQLAEWLAPHPPDNYEELALALHRLALDPQFASGPAAQRALSALTALAPLRAQRLRAAAADLVLQRLLTSSPELEPCAVLHLAALGARLLADESAAEAAALTALLLRLPQHDAARVESYALRHDCITGKLHCPFEDDNEAMKLVSADEYEEMTRETFLSYAKKLLFRAAYLRTILLPKPDEQDSSRCDELLQHERLRDELCKLLHDAAILDTLHEGYAFWAEYDVVQRAHEHLREPLAALERAGAGARVRGELRARAAERGYYWAAAAGQGGAGGELADIVTGNGYIHTLQVNSWRKEESEEDESELRCSFAVLARAAVLAPAREPRASAELLASASPRRPAPLLDLCLARDDLLLRDEAVCGASWAACSSSAALAQFLSGWVRRAGAAGEAREWDCCALALCGLLRGLAQARGRLARPQGCTKAALLLHAALRLLEAVRAFVAALPKAAEQQELPAHVWALRDEWADVFAPDLDRHLLEIVQAVLERPSPVVSLAAARALAALRAAAARLPVRRAQAPALAEKAARALRATAHRGHARLAHALLAALAEPFVLHDAEQLSAWSEAASADDGEEGDAPRPQFAPALLLREYRALLDELHAQLEHVPVGAPPVAAPPAALGALLLADALYALCALARGDLAHQYMLIMRDQRLTELLLEACLRLLPAPVHATLVDPAAPPLRAEHVLLFTDTVLCTIDDPEQGWPSSDDASEAAALACRGIYLALAGPGAGAARRWHSTAPRRAAALLARACAAGVAPALVRAQLQEVSWRARDIPDTAVAVHWAAREVVAEYSSDERPLQLQVQLAPAHPLAPPSACGASAQWVRLYLAHQGGSLLGALRLWAAAVHARLERAPQCYVCYCRLHPSSGAPPRMHCSTCRNRFHSACLRKWFASSNKSNCPLCRAAF